MQRVDAKKFWDVKLFIIVSCCSIVCIAYSLILSAYIMPNFNKHGLSLTDQVKSSSMSDSESYVRYAEGILKYRSFKNDNGDPIFKHMPGTPLILAIGFSIFSSLKSFIIFQILFFFASLYLFLIKAKEKIPLNILIISVFVITFHPSMIKLFSSIMSDILFATMILLIAFVLWKDSLSWKDFFYAGILFSLAVYIRESALPFVLVLIFAYIVNYKRYYYKEIIMMFFVLLVCLSPWTIRNYIYTHKFIPLTTKTVDLFYVWSIPLTNESYTPLGPKFQGGYNFPAMLAKRASFIESNPPGTNLIKAGIYNYYSRPAEQLKSMLLKTIALFDKPELLGRPLSNQAEIGLKIINILFYMFHFGVILFGVFLSFTKKYNPFVYLPYLIIIQYFQALFFWSISRYLIPFYPLLIIIALSWYREKWNHVSQNSRLLLN